MVGAFLINELQDFIKQQPSHLEAFDEALVKRWLERIIVWVDHFTVELKSRLKFEIEPLLLDCHAATFTRLYTLKIC